MSQIRQNNTSPMSPTNHCDGRRGDIALPIAQSPAQGRPEGAIRPSRMGRRRAIVLVAVQLLMIAHFVQWYITGRTTTPIEPSESMEFVKHGVVNAGLIFFSIALLSTLVLGRWFCGWGCHIVMLQDGCGWLMKKMGVRPKPFRSRLLVWAPLVLALYMFVWPAVYRWCFAPPPGAANELAAWGWRTQFTTTDFWHTFAGIGVAIPFLLVCGFATVYFLGAKGFCTYGCPYGGFFAPLDRLAPARIRVTDACEHCGHCTAVCTSNVRVHEEVRDYGMVVDPGCMKCMDCVSVCPNDALYFGLGAPALSAEPRVDQPARRHYDLTWGEEILCAAAFITLFFAFRSLYSVVPMLFAVGIAGCGTFLIWKSWRLLGDRDARLHRFQLKRGGRLAAAGVAWLVLTAALVGLTLHSALVQYHVWHGLRLANSIAVSTEDAFRGPVSVGSTTAGRIDAARAHLRKADAMSEGGIGLLGQPEVPIALARLDLIGAQWEECERQLRRGIALGENSDVLTRNLARVMLKRGAAEPVITMLRATLADHPEFDLSRATLVILLESAGRADEAQRVRAERPTR